MAPNVFMFQETVTAITLKPIIFGGVTVPSSSKVKLRGFRSDGVLVAESRLLPEFPLELRDCRPENPGLLKKLLTSISRISATHEMTLHTLAESLGR